jgi:SAM-dependent methyltransferase
MVKTLIAPLCTISLIFAGGMTPSQSLPTDSIDALNARCYNANADYWDRMPFADFLPAQILLTHDATTGMRALDIGSGTGQLADWLVKHGFDLLCLDPSEEMVRRCRAKKLITVQTTLQHFSCAEKFGLISAVLSLIHVPKQELPNELKRISNWLNPGGTFVLALIEGQGEGVKEKGSDYPRYFSYYTCQEILDPTRKDFDCVYKNRTSGPIAYLVFIFKKK